MPALASCLRSLFAVLMLALAFARPAAATDWTDIWWNPAEDGWGVNFVQANNFIFATFFIYGPDKQPTWYTGQMTYNSSNNTWSGGLYRTTGSYFAGAWNTTDKTINQVGNVTFTPASSYAGTLQYNVGTLNVTKSIERQTLTSIPLGGNYKGAIVSVFSNCNDSSLNGTFHVFVDAAAVQTTGGALQLYFQDPSSTSTTCVQQGTYIQNGQLYRIPGASYTCGSTFAAASTNVSQIKATNQGIEWQWVSTLGSQYPGCVETGYLSAVLL